MFQENPIELVPDFSVINSSSPLESLIPAP